MLFRIAFTAAMIVLSLNISQVFNIERANAVEKSFLLVAAIILLIRGRISPAALACAGFIVLATLISGMFTDYYGFDWSIYYRSLASLTATLLFLVAIPRKDDSEFALLVFAFIPLIQLLIAALYQVQFGFPMLRPDPLTGSVRLGGTTAPAFFAPLAVAGAFAAVFLGDFRSRLYLLLVPINGVILLLTAARMPALVFVLCCGSALMLSFHGRLTMKLMVIISGAAFSVIIGIIFSERILGRFASGSLTGREIIWSYLQQIADQYPLFGIGLGHQTVIVPRAVTLATGTVAAHNEYLRIMVEVGWVGSILMMIGGLALFVTIWSSRRIAYNPIFLIAVVAFAIYSLTDNTLSRYEANAVLVVALLGCYRISQSRTAKTRPLLARAQDRYQGDQPSSRQPASPTIRANEI